MTKENYTKILEDSRLRVAEGSSTVTAVDLNLLWRVANVHLPALANLFTQHVNKLHKIDDPPDDQKYGKCHPWWTTLACLLERTTFETSCSMTTAANALNVAMDAIIYVDGDNGNKLNELGQQLEDEKNAKDQVFHEDFVDDFTSPNLTYPDSW